MSLLLRAGSRKDSGFRKAGKADSAPKSLRRLTTNIATQNVIVKASKGAGHAVSSKTPVTFAFDITFESIENCPAKILGNVVLIWERGKHQVCSPPFKIQGRRAEVDFSFSRDVTLYRGSNENESMCEKVYKVALRAGHGNGKTLGKIHMDMANYADVMGGERKLSLKLSNGASVIVHVASKFLGAGKRKKVDSDAASQSTVNTYMSSSDIGSDDGYNSGDNLDDLDDLECDIQFATEIENASRHSLPMQKIDAPAASTPRETASDVESSSAADAVTQKKIKQTGEKIAVLQEENQRMKLMLSSSNAVALENEVLRRKISEIEEMLSKPPKEENLVRDLTDAKLQLANECYEMEEVTLQVQALKRDMIRKKKSSWF